MAQDSGKKDELGTVRPDHQNGMKCWDHLGGNLGTTANPYFPEGSSSVTQAISRNTARGFWLLWYIHATSSQDICTALIILHSLDNYWKSVSDSRKLYLSQSLLYIPHKLSVEADSYVINCWMWKALHKGYGRSAQSLWRMQRGWHLSQATEYKETFSRQRMEEKPFYGEGLP